MDLNARIAQARGAESMTYELRRITKESALGQLFAPHVSTTCSRMLAFFPILCLAPGIQDLAPVLSY